ncbi:hypothetical protein [Thalassotalea sp. PS06]|uniref:hypothetical protein n=1 Tax=Thalassotalea sp. PS06 TaxID=2594005 RepID=UPI001165542A|nr:hypothetical protein [Thalassotalea sp. PS06]QDP02196.1 hypothetical protein FNC98_13105 [Thalassotalea sp. PS06]
MDIEKLMAEFNEPATLTILKAVSPAVPMTKIFTKDGTKPYPNAYKFDVKQFDIPNIEELAKALTDLQRQPQTCVIRGKLKQGTSAEQVQRKVRGDESLFTDAANKIIHIDVDGVEAPESMAIEQWPEYIIEKLPTPFHKASYFYQYSSSVGMKPGIRLHLWFMSTMPFDNSEFKRWYSHLPDEQQLLIDDAVFRPVQVNYIQAPIFDGVEDPLADLTRSGLVTKSEQTVSLVIPEQQLKIRQPLNTEVPEVLLSKGNPMNAFYKKEWQIEHSGRLHIPILAACSAYKWACEAKGVDEDVDWCVDRLRDAVSRSSHIDKDGVYSTDDYLYAQFESAQIAKT